MEQKKLTFAELFSIGIGFTLGSAVFSLTGVAAMYTGGSTFLAYIVGAFAIVFMMLPVIVAASIVPRQGVSYSLSKEALCHSMGGFYFYIFFIGRIANLANCTAFAIFLTSVFTTLNQNMVAGAIAVIFFITNYFGMKSAAKVQNILNVILFAAMACFIVFGFIHMDTVLIFNRENFITGGALGFFSAVSTVVFAMGGGMAMLELGGSVENAEKNLPKACFLITLCAGVLFAAIALGTLGSLPIVPMAEGGATMPGTLLFKGPSNAVINAAADIFENMPALQVFFLLGGATLAIGTTINGSYGWYSAPVLVACKDGWFPKFFSKTNKYGVPYRIQFIFVLAVLIPIFFIKPENIGSVNTNVIKVSTNLQILANIIPNFGLLAIPKLYKNVWEKSAWHMSDVKLKLLMWIPTIFSLYMWTLNFRGLAPTAQKVLAILCVIGVAYAVIGAHTFAKPKSASEQES